MRIAEIVKAKGTEIYTAEPATSLTDATVLMRSNGIGSLVVIGSDGELVGVLSERDIVSAFANHGAEATSVTVSTAVRRDTPICSMSDTIENVMAKMTTSRSRHLPVFDGNQLVGLVSIGDVVKGRLAELEYEAHLVHEYVTWGR